MTKAFSRAAVAWMLFLSLCAACGGDGKNGRTIAVDQFFDTYLSTLCDSSSRYSSGIITATNKGTCPKAIMDSLFAWPFFHAGRNTVFKQKVYLLRQAEVKGWLSLDADQAKVCFETIDRMQPYNPLDVRLLDIPECALVFTGKKIINDFCTQDEECEGGWCNFSGGACPGRCVLYRRQGEPCNENLDRCEPGYACLSSGCARLSRGEKGDPCTADEHCLSYLYCKKAEGDLAGICFEKKGIGRSCEKPNECLTGLDCVDSLCQGLEIPNTVGADCSEVKMCNYFSRLECAREGSVYTTCRTFPSGEGSPCTFQCSDQFYCNPLSGTCTYFSRLDEPCGVYYQCSSLYCGPGGLCLMPECEQTF